MHLNRTRLVNSYRQLYTERRASVADAPALEMAPPRVRVRRAADSEMWLSEKIAMSFAAAISQPLRGMSRRNAIVRQARARKPKAPKDPLAHAEQQLSRAAQRDHAASAAQTANRRAAMSNKPGATGDALSRRAKIDQHADASRTALQRRADEVRRLRADKALEDRARAFKDKHGISLAEHNDKLIAANRAAMAKDAKRRARKQPAPAPTTGNNHAGHTVSALRGKLKGKAKGLGKMRKADLVALADQHFGKTFAIRLAIKAALSARGPAPARSRLSLEPPMNRFERTLYVKALRERAAAVVELDRKEDQEPTMSRAEAIRLERKTRRR